MTHRRRLCPKTLPRIKWAQGCVQDGFNDFIRTHGCVQKKTDTFSMDTTLCPEKISAIKLFTNDVR